MITDYKLVKASQIEDFKRPWWWTFSPESDKEILPTDVRTLRSHALRLFKNLGPLRTCILDKAMYSIGNNWDPKYVGEDSDYGAAAVPWLVDNWYPICNTLGEEFNFKTTLTIASVHLDVFSEYFFYLTESENGYPMIQTVPCYRVDQPRLDGAVDTNGLITGKYLGGTFKGCKIVWGVVKNKQGRPIAYHVLGDDPDGADDQLISADDLIRVREMDMGNNETRATPTCSHGINQGRSILSLLENEQEFLEAASRISLIESNDLGGVDVNDPQNALALRTAAPSPVGMGETLGNGSTAPPLYTEEWKQSGETRYFKSKSGGNVQAFQFQRPAKEWQDFISSELRFLCDPIWPYQLIDKEAELPGTIARGVIARANRLVQKRQHLIKRVARKMVQYAVAKGAKLGRIPESDNWWQWSFDLPRSITLDFGRDSKQELLEVEAGVRDRAEMVEERGQGDYLTWVRRRYVNAAQEMLIQKEVEAEFGVDLTAASQAPVITGSGQPDVVD